MDTVSLLFLDEKENALNWSKAYNISLARWCAGNIPNEDLRDVK